MRSLQCQSFPSHQNAILTKSRMLNESSELINEFVSYSYSVEIENLRDKPTLRADELLGSRLVHVFMHDLSALLPVSIALLVIKFNSLEHSMSF